MEIGHKGDARERGAPHTHTHTHTRYIRGMQGSTEPFLFAFAVGGPGFEVLCPLLVGGIFWGVRGLLLPYYYLFIYVIIYNKMSLTLN